MVLASSRFLEWLSPQSIVPHYNGHNGKVQVYITSNRHVEAMGLRASFELLAMHCTKGICRTTWGFHGRSQEARAL